MQHQSKLASFVEAIVNNLIGMAMAFAAQAFLFHMVGIHASVQQNVGVVLGMTVVSIIRSYVIRRVFNAEWWKDWFMRGATAYEWQIGPVYGRITHLQGDFWKWKPWRRFSIHLDRRWIKDRQLRWKYRHQDDSVCCCGSQMAEGGSICHHGGCRSLKDYVIEKELERG